MFHIIDNHSTAREALEQLIEHQAYHYRSFASMALYLDYINRPDCMTPTAILVDYALLNTQVFQCIERLKQQLSNPQIVLLMSIDCAEWSQVAKANACYTLNKPYQPQAVYSLMATLSNRKMLSEIKSIFHIVEDTQFARTLLEEMLLKIDVESQSFASAQAYIDYVNSTSFQLPVATFTDIMMPLMNGYEMIANIHAAHGEMKFIIATNEPRIRNEYMHLACLYLAKPYSLDKLAAVVAQLKHCHSCGASKPQACTASDDRQAFHVSNWSCPHPDSVPIIEASQCESAEFKSS